MDGFSTTNTTLSSAPPTMPAPPMSYGVPPERNRKPIIWVGLIALILIGLAAAGWYFWQKQADERIAALQQVKIKEQVSDALQNCANSADPDNCQFDLIKDSAIAAGEVALCELLTGSALDYCWFNLAQELGRPELCQSISDANLSQSCNDVYYRDLSLAGQDIALCASIIDSDNRRACRLTLLPALDQAACLDAGFSAAECELIFFTKQASDAKDPALCQTLFTASEDIEYCLEMVVEDDPDFDGLHTQLELQFGSDPRKYDTDDDGLNDYEEVMIYGTDPRNPDTDGDGFTDGQEVESGYNPAGEGKL